MDPRDRAIIHGSTESGWRTPAALYQKLDATFHFVLDLAADKDSRCCSLYYGPDHPNPERRDAFAVDWHDASRERGIPSVGFLNPPYSLKEIRQLKAQGCQRAGYQHLQIASWAWKAHLESLLGFTTVGVFPYAPQTEWFRRYVMGHTTDVESGQVIWSGHAALDYWKIPHRVGFLHPDGSPSSGAGVNTCIIIWGPNPGFVGPWVPSGRYWSYR